MRDTCEESDDYAEGYSVGEEVKRGVGWLGMSDAGQLVYERATDSISLAINTSTRLLLIQSMPLLTTSYSL